MRKELRLKNQMGELEKVNQFVEEIGAVFQNSIALNWVIHVTRFCCSLNKNEQITSTSMNRF